MTTTTSRLEGQTSSEAIKAPCIAATTANITLSGEQTIDGVAVVAGNRVLVKDQTTASENGIYIVSTTAWERARDFNGARDVAQGTMVRVNSGTAEDGLHFITTANPITIGTTDLAFEKIPEASISDLDDIDDSATYVRMLLIERNKLSTIETGAEVNDDIVAGSNVTVTGGSGSDWTISAGGGAVALDDLSDVTADAAVTGIYGLSYDNGTGEYDDVLLTDTFYTESESDTLFAAASHTHAASDVTSGTFADARISESSVTQHEAALSITESQISDLGSYLDSGDIGVSVQAYDADTAKTDVEQEFTAQQRIPTKTVSVSGTTKTLALTDANTIQECSNASDQTITVPANASVAIPTGSGIIYEQQGAGNVVLSAASGVTINGVTGTGGTTNQYDALFTRKTGSDAWIAYAMSALVIDPPAPTNSLEFDGSTDYLQMSGANFGAYDYTQFSIICSFYADTTANDYLFSKGDGPSSESITLRVNNSTGSVLFGFRDTGDGSRSDTFTIPSYSNATWYAIKVDFDGSQTGADRVKVYVNGSEVAQDGSNTWATEVQNTTDPASWGSTEAGTASVLWDGFIHQPTFISGSNPSNADVFDGTAGKLKNLSGLTGVYSHISADSDAVSDTILATDWTNNGTVTTSATVP